MNQGRERWLVHLLILAFALACTGLAILMFARVFVAVRGMAA